MSYLSKSIEAACKEENTTPSRKFAQLKMNPSSASKLLKTRPSVTTLQFLCAPSAWGNPEIPLILLSAHLKDEILRAARSIDEISVHICGDKKADIPLEDAITAIDSLAKRKDSFRDLLIDISKTIKKHPQS